MSGKRTRLSNFQCLAIAWAISTAIIFLWVKCANASTCPTCGCTQEQAIAGALDAECPMPSSVAQQQCVARAITPCSWTRWEWSPASGLLHGDPYQLQVCRSYWNECRFEAHQRWGGDQTSMMLHSLVGPVGSLVWLRVRATHVDGWKWGEWSQWSEVHRFVPEPSRGVLLLSGIVTLVVMRRVG